MAAPVSQATATTTASKPTRDLWLIHLLSAPAIFVLLAALPIQQPPYAIRCGLGLLIWMAWWWLMRPVHLAVTGLLPLVVISLAGVLPMPQILPAYSDELVILLVGANILTTAWERWGVDRRFALATILGVGTSPARQITVWFLTSAAFATLLPRVVVAATLVPIAIAMLRFVGVDDLWESKVGTALVLAIAFGSSLGGFLTPLGGAPNLLAMKFVQDTVTHHEFLFVTWIVHLLPLTVAVLLAVLVYVNWSLKFESAELPGTRAYFTNALHALGSVSRAERWVLGLFFAAIALAFGRIFYSRLVPAFTPAFAFLLCGLLTFVVRIRGERLLEWDYAQKKMMWGLFYVFAGGTALGTVLSKTGTAVYIANDIVPYASHGLLPTLTIFAALTIAVAQIISNVASVAIMVPITVSVAQTLHLNPLPLVYVVIAASHCGFMLPSSSGSAAVAAGYGVNLRAMLVKGFWAALICLAVIIATAYVSILIWPGFGAA
jgi:solute carrier family 13 (sodium-dependent dicarboxylate transporter), member 2/3/5